MTPAGIEGGAAAPGRPKQGAALSEGRRSYSTGGESS